MNQSFTYMAQNFISIAECSGLFNIFNQKPENILMTFAKIALFNSFIVLETLGLDVHDLLLKLGHDLYIRLLGYTDIGCISQCRSSLYVILTKAHKVFAVLSHCDAIFQLMFAQIFQCVIGLKTFQLAVMVAVLCFHTLCESLSVKQCRFL